MPPVLIDPWILLGLLAFSAVVTLTANWIVFGLQRPRLPRIRSFAFFLSLILNLLWILLIFFAGVVATRYIERIANAAIGYAVFAVVAFSLSLARASLHRRIQEQQKDVSLSVKAPLLRLLHSSIYLLLAIASYLALCLLLHHPVDLILLLPLCVGAILPDLDSGDSLAGRLLPFVSRRLEARLGSFQEWHSLGANLSIALVTAPLIPLIGLEAWGLVSLGFFLHLVLDLPRPQGIMLFWPVTRTRYYLFGGLIGDAGSRAERNLAAGLAILVVALLLVVEIGPTPPPSVATPSYQETLESYRAMRGRNLVFANVEGVWQITGRRMNGRFEILNASGDSFILLDRYSGSIFTAGRSAGDNLYLNRVSLQTGPSISVKPVEIHLQDQRLGDALALVYEMQREPGLEHIYASGDVVLPESSDGDDPGLQTDYAQTSLRRIEAHENGHFTLRYLTASDLIELANLRVEIADLVIVATYASPVAGPTVTPLPSPPPTLEPRP